MNRSMGSQKSGSRESAEFSEKFLLERLMSTGVGRLDDWRALSPRARRNIFGITSSMVRAIDQMAKAQPK